MAGNISTTINPAALQADGAYVAEQIESQLLPAGPNSGLVLFPGAANWGKPNIVQYFSDYDSGIPFFGDTDIGLSSSSVDYGLMARVFLAAMAGASSFACVRITDGTDVAAGSVIGDDANPVSGHELVTLTAVSTGSKGNAISYRLDLVSGTNSAYPVYRLTVFPFAGSAEVFTIVAYTTGGSYSSTVFTANAIAAINGTDGKPASNWLVASAPGGTPSVLNPYTGAVVFLTAGTDGNSGLTDTDIVGTDGASPSTRTGLYAFRNLAAAGTVLLPGVTAFDTFESLALFCEQEICMGVWGNFPLGTETATAVSDRQTNALSSTWLLLVEDWVEFVDPVSGLTRYLEPSASAAGVVAGTVPFKYVGNKPYAGIQGLLATEYTATGLTMSTAEAGERESNGIDWIGNPIPRGAVFGLFHGMMSDAATLSSDLRMANIIALNIQAILSQFVGEMQSTSSSDLTRSAARAKVNEYMSTLAGQINDYKDTLDTTNNTPTTIAQGQMLCSLEVQTLGAVRFAIAAVQVGTGVQISVSPVS